MLNAEFSDWIPEPEGRPEPVLSQMFIQPSGASDGGYLNVLLRWGIIGDWGECIHWVCNMVAGFLRIAFGGEG